ncbi:MAG TPA: zinc-ribbon domain-containing protein [Candidatus Udaeobacter sp.]|jgi:predicted Zn finger-like uncharacterized protein|nr:zinc-ribbon domain-containing protein [Candidatus Udaeobacter sp.]
MTPDPAPIRVTCPQCGIPYLLPARLLGPGGARVRCPGCGTQFDVAAPAAAETVTAKAAPATAEDEGTAAPPAAAAEIEGTKAARATAPAETPAGASEPAPSDVAREVLDALAAVGGADLRHAIAEGRLFAEFGPQIFAAYDEYRRRAKRGGPDPFRLALRDRFGVDLPEVTPRS